MFQCLYPSPSHRPPDLLRSEGIPSVDPLPSPSPLSGSPKVSTPPGKARYRSKPRHRRVNSKGSHNDFPGVLKSSSIGISGAASSEEQQPLQQQQQQQQPQTPQLYHHHHHLQQYHHHHHQTLPVEGALLPLKGREDAVATCANNLRYFGPAAALRSPQTDHFQRRMSGSSPDLISTAVDADSRRVAGGSSNGLLDPTVTGTEDASGSPMPMAVGLGVSSSSLSSGPGPLCPCCQAHPYPDCPHCQEETVPPISANHPEMPHYSLLSTCEASPQAVSETEAQGHQGDRVRVEQGSPRGSLSSGVVRMLRPLRKVSGRSEISECFRFCSLNSTTVYSIRIFKNVFMLF